MAGNKFTWLFMIALLTVLMSGCDYLSGASTLEVDSIYNAISIAAYPENRGVFVLVVGDNSENAEFINKEKQYLSPLLELIGTNSILRPDELTTEKNLIIVGRPEANSLSASLFGDVKLQPGEAIIKTDYSDGLKIYVAGYTPEDTKKAIDILINFESNKELLLSNTHKISDVQAAPPTSTPSESDENPFDSEDSISASNSADKESSTKDVKQSSSVWLWIIITLIILIAVPALFLMKKKASAHEALQKIENENTNTLNEGEDGYTQSTTSAKSAQENKQESTLAPEQKTKLENYVATCFKRGVTESRVKQLLLQSKWPKQAVEDAIKKVKA